MNILDSIRSGIAPVHREGYRFVAIGVAATLICHWLGLWPFTLLFVVLTAWCAYFFRDPQRVTPISDKLIVAPADGKVSAIAKVTPPPELDLPREPMTRISIFMNVFDVHINRSPVRGRIAKINYVPGAFLNAELDKASEDNERKAHVITTSAGIKIGVVQIAGLVARRILGFVGEGEELAQGQRFGLIRFGSRVDVYLPEGYVVKVGVGQRTLAGESIIAATAGEAGAIEFRKS